MSRGTKNKTEGVGSLVLSQQENDKLEDLVGRRCAVSSPLTWEGFGYLGHDIPLFLSRHVLFVMKAFTVKVKGPYSLFWKQ